MESESKITNEENVSSENALLSFSQYPEIKRKEFDSKIEDDYYNEIKLLTNLFNYKIDKESGKNIYLYGIDVNEISSKNIDNFKVSLIKKLSKNDKFKEILHDIFGNDYLISGLVLYGIPKDKKEQIEFIFFMLINIDKDINKPNKLIYSIIKIEKDETKFDKCEENQMILKIKLTKKYNLKDTLIKKDIKSQYRNFLNILTGKILKQLGYKKDSSTRKILYYKKEDVEELKNQENIYSKIYSFPALKAICDYYKGSNTYHTYLKLYPKLILTPNDTYENYYKYLLDKYNNENNIKEIFKQNIKNRRGIKLYNYEIIKIEDVIFENPYKLNFVIKDEKISVGEYYINIYKIKLKNEKMPIAIRYIDNNGKLKEPIKLYFPCCLIKTVGNLYEESKINVKDFVKRPDEKYNEIIQIKNKFSKKFKENFIDSGLFKGMKGKLNNIEATAYVLKAQILFSSESKEVELDGSFDLRNTKPVKENDNKINNSEVFMFGLTQNQSEFLFNQLQEASKLLNIKIEEPFVTDLNDCVNFNNDELYDYLLKLFKEREKDKKTEIVFLFMDSFYKKSIYKIFKQSLNDSNWKVPSQCILYDKKKFPKSVNLSQFTNILSQIWAKKGSEIYKCNIGFLKHNIIIAYSTSFIVKNNKKKLLTSLCISRDKYYCEYKFDSEIEEIMIGSISSKIGDMIKSNLIKILKSNKKEIKNIIIYREGLNEKYIKKIQKFEIIDKILPTINELKKDFNNLLEKSKLIFILCNKLTDIRFLNTEVGTVIDKKVVNEEYYDFYLNSIYSRQGTNSPTHYIVLYDDTELTANNIYKLTYYLTFQCYNTTKSIKVPAPLYFVTRRNNFTREALNGKIINKKLKLFNISL